MRASTHKAADVTRSSSTAARVQAKLRVRPAHDALEGEADRVAAAVVAPRPAADGGLAHPGPAPAARVAPSISRREETATRGRKDEEDPRPRMQPPEEERADVEVQRQEDETSNPLPADEEDEGPEGEEETREDSLQRREEPRANVRDKRQFPVLDKVEGKLFENKGRGEPLPEATRTEMEVGFGTDFGGVRVHTGADAAQMSRDLQAQAFTHGKDIFFGTGRFEPETTHGRELLAHELTHVVQQGAAEQKLSPETVERNNADRHRPPPEPADEEPRTAEGNDERRLAAGTTETGPTGTDATSPATAQPAEAPRAEGATEGTGIQAGPPPPGPAEAGGAAESKPRSGKAEPAPAKKGQEAAGTRRAPGVVGAFLRRTSEAVFRAKTMGIRQLADNEKKKEPAEAKLAQTENAVEPPANEAASRAQASQVERVDQAPEPEPDPAAAQAAFQSALQAAVPTTLEKVDRFKEQKKGQMVGLVVKETVSRDAQAVRETYQDIENPPAATPPPQRPEPLPEIETPAETGALEAGEGVVGEVLPEHTDLSAFETRSDALLEKEQIGEEQLRMVDEGDLAEAHKERQAVRRKVQEGPKEVGKLEQDEKQKLRQELRKDEDEGRRQMRQERQRELGGARGDQQKAKTALELERQKVTDRIRGIYERANTNVRQKLDHLESASLRAFDQGQRRATHDFEGGVKRRIDAFKRRRYDRTGGSLLWAKDKLFGMDELPEVQSIFDDEKSRFVTSIDALVQKITTDSQRVVEQCRGIVQQAREEIEELVAGLGPSLRQAGEAALGEIKGKLDALDQQIDRREKALQEKLAAKREAAIEAIEKRIEEMREEMSGAVSKLGNLLLDAALKFFRWVLKKAGFSTEQLMGILNKGKAVITSVVTDPIAFIGNLVRGVKGGIDLFVKNIRKHLVGGLIAWLTGAMADVPIQLPKTFDLKGILHLVLQILGLTWDRIRAKLVKRVGEKVVKVAETTVDIVKRLITEGPMAPWEMIKSKAAEIKQKVMEGIRNWVITRIVKQAVVKLVSFLNPAGAIVQAVLAIYNTVMFFVENWRRIADFVNSVFESISDIAMGKLSKASQAVERALATTIPVILGFLARLIGLGSIGKAITRILRKIRGPFDKILDRVITRVATLARKLMKKGKAAAKKAKEAGIAALQWWKKKRLFKSPDGKSHKVFFKGKGKHELLVASETKKKKDVIEMLPAEKRARVEKLYDDVILLSKDRSNKPDVGKKIDQGLREIGVEIAEHLGPGAPPPSNVTFKTSGKKALEVLAQPLTRLRGSTRGQESTANSANDYPPAWGFITQKVHTAKGSIRHVRTHLLSHQLHGPATSWNLAPTPSQFNTPGGMLPMEKAVQRYVEEKNGVLRFRAKVSYHSGTEEIDPAFKGSKKSNFPKKIQVTLQERKGKQFKPASDPLIAGFKNHNVGPIPLPTAAALTLEDYWQSHKGSVQTQQTKNPYLSLSGLKRATNFSRFKKDKPADVVTFVEQKLLEFHSRHFTPLDPAEIKLLGLLDRDPTAVQGGEAALQSLESKGLARRAKSGEYSLTPTGRNAARIV